MNGNGRWRREGIRAERDGRLAEKKKMALKETAAWQRKRKGR